MKIHHISLFVFLIFMFYMPQLQAVDTTQEIVYQNETVSFRLQEFEPCRLQTSILRIERKNYSSGVPPLDIAYDFVLWESDRAIINQTITKTINKYSASSTGVIPENITGPHRLHIIINNETMHWNVIFTCELVVENTNNSIHNNSIANVTTSINNTLDNTSFEINTTGNISINNTINNSESVNTTTLNQTNNSKQPISCITANITVNAEEYFVGDKLRMDFGFHPIFPGEYAYWITDIVGSSVKANKTSQNTNTKTHTFKQFDDTDKIYRIWLAYDTNCGDLQTTHKQIIVYNPSYDPKKNNDDLQPKTVASASVTNTDTTTTDTSFIRFSEASISSVYDAPSITTSLEIYKAHTRKSVVTVYARKDGTRISAEQKISLKTQNSLQEFSLIIPLKKSFGTIELLAEGLDVQASTWLELPPKKEESLGSQTVVESATTHHKKEFVFENIVINTSAIPPPIETANYREEKTRTVILSASVTVLLLGVFIGFGPRKAIDTFIKH